jgi:alpha-1,2-mannosyltransferase
MALTLSDRKVGVACLVAVALITVVEIILVIRTPITDLRVYRAGAQAFVDGTDIYRTPPIRTDLPFTYPPFAAIVMVPLAVLPYSVAFAILTAISVPALVIALRVVLGRLWPGWSDRRVWVVATVVTAAATQLFWPVIRTLTSGQVNLILMALVTVDLLRPGRRRGMLLGIATGIKVTPVIFIVYLGLTRRWREAATAAGTAAATVLVGVVLAPGASVRYWTHLLFEPGRVGPQEYVSNQSLHGMLTRLTGGPDRAVVPWLALELIVGCWGLVMAYLAHRRGDEVLAVLLTAVTGLVVSPISWVHHWVWALPVGLLLWRRCWPAAVLWLVLFVVQPIFWVPHGGGLDYTQHGLQVIAGNSLVLAGLVLLAAAPLLLRAGHQRE